MKNPLRRLDRMVTKNSPTPRNMISFCVVVLTLGVLAVAATFLLIGIIVNVFEALGLGVLMVGLAVLVVWSFIHFWKVTNDEA